MLKIAFKNLGCKVNNYELLNIKKQFLYNDEYDFTEIDFNSNDSYDICIINSCSVTQIADKKTRQMFHKAKENNKNAVIVVIGCYIDSHINEEDDNINIKIKNNDKNKTFDIVIDYLIKNNLLSKNIIKKEKEYKFDDNQRIRANVKIEDGCNQFCSYCIIPYLRGRIKSRAKEDILNEINLLAKQNIKEIILTGIHLSSYSLDFYNLSYESNGAIDIARNNLLDLIIDISKISSIKRIRLGSLEPRIIDLSFIKKLNEIEKVCFEFHLSLQSGSDTILKLMNRHYTTKDFENAVSIIRTVNENATISTDIIVGFPSETDENFNETLEFCKKIKFYNPHIFPYSLRPNTKAYDLPNRVDEKTKKLRVDKLIIISDEISIDIRKNFINNSQYVLIESVKNVIHNNKESFLLSGFNKEYIKFNIYISKDDYSLEDLTKYIGEEILCYDLTIYDDYIVANKFTK